LGNDTDTENDPLTAVLVTDVSSGTLNLAADGSFSYDPNPGFIGSDSFTYQANDGLADSNIATVTITVNSGLTILDALANSDIFVAGTVNGDYKLTNLDDGNAESITERVSGGKPQNRYSYLEHKWSFNLTAGNLTTLHANTWSGGSSDGDNFVFSYSTDDVTYTEMFIVSDTAYNGYETFILPPSIQGTLFVRVVDSDHSSGHSSLDTIFIDHLFIRIKTEPGDPPAAPTGLGVSAISASQINLTWTDNAEDEEGFYVERSNDGSNWSVIDTVGVDASSYTDATVFPGSQYTYRVKAYNGSGSSEYSNVITVTTPEGINLTAIGYKVLSVYTVDLNWSGGSVVLYDIFRDGSQMAEDIDSNTYTDDVGKKGIYTYQVCEANSLTNCSNIVVVDFK